MLSIFHDNYKISAVGHKMLQVSYKINYDQNCVQQTHLQKWKTHKVHQGKLEQFTKDKKTEKNSSCSYGNEHVFYALQCCTKAIQIELKILNSIQNKRTQEQKSGWHLQRSSFSNSTKVVVTHSDTALRSNGACLPQAFSQHFFDLNFSLLNEFLL